jgi:hypothetical protein
MKRLDENLREYSKGKYVLFTDYEEEVARLKEELKNLKKEFKIATTVHVESTKIIIKMNT